MANPHPRIKTSAKVVGRCRRAFKWMRGKYAGAAWP